MMRAQRMFLNPSIGRTLRLIARWSCSTTFFTYFDCRILIGVPRSALIATSAVEAAYVNRYGLRDAVPGECILEISLGAALSRSARNRKSTVSSALSTAL
jgi:hypothetical protein